MYRGPPEGFTDVSGTDHPAGSGLCSGPPTEAQLVPWSVDSENWYSELPGPLAKLPSPLAKKLPEPSATTTGSDWPALTWRQCRPPSTDTAVPLV